MKSLFSIFFLLMTLLTLTSCDTSTNFLEADQQQDPYWWRDDPYFANKQVDEEATLAVRLPNTVITQRGEVEVQNETLQHMLDPAHFSHLLTHHADLVGPVLHSLQVPEPGDICPCLDFIAGEPVPPHCEDSGTGGGTGGGAPPPNQYIVWSDVAIASQTDPFRELSALTYTGSTPGEMKRDDVR